MEDKLIYINEKSEFYEILNKNDKICVLFAAVYCDERCDKFKEMMNSLGNQSEYRSIKYLVVDVEVVHEIADEYKINAAPTIIGIKAKEIVFRNNDENINDDLVLCLNSLVK